MKLPSLLATKTRASALAASAMLLGSNLQSHAQVVFSDDFDSFSSPSGITNTAPITTNRYNILFGAGGGGTDFTAVFGFDYSTVVYPAPIPSAPNSIGGTTKGLFLTVNKSDATVQPAAVNLYPTNQFFSGNYSLKFDVWINWTNLATSTEHILAGLDHSGTIVNRQAQANSDGIFIAMDGDGGSSPTSATGRDFSMFRGGGGAGIPFLLTTNNTTFGPAPLLGPQFDHANPGFATLFPSKTIPGYPTTPAGTPGLGWVTCELRQETNVITWSLNGTIVAQFTNNTVYGSGNVMIGYNDFFGSIGDVANYAIFDNISVTALGGLPVVAVTNSIPTASEAGPASGQFTLIRGGDTSGSLTVSYTMSGTAGNGTDYSTLPGTITFLPGAAVTNLLLTPVDDPTPEPLETAILSINSDVSYTVGAPSSATVSIIDNDTPTISIASAQPILLEGVSASRVPLTLTRIGLTNTALTVNLAYSGTATRNADYTSAATVSIAAGAITASINMSPIDDTLVEGTEAATVAVTTGNGYAVGSPSSVNVTIVDDDVLPGNTLFADVFDTAGSSASWTLNSGGADAHADFGYNYGTDGIPEAPSSPAGSATQRGLKLRVNETTSLVGGMSLSPLNGDFENNYRLRFDMWLNYAGPLNNANVPGQTQAGSAGIGVTGAEVVYPASGSSSGIWFSETCDGGSAALAGDYNAYAANTLFDDSSGVYAAGAVAGVRDNVNAYYTPWPAVSAPAAEVTAHPTQTGTTGVGTFGNAWHKVAITKRVNNNSVIWNMDGRRIATVDISALLPFISTNVFVGYHDPFASITTNAACQFGLFDNVRVETLSRPNITSLIRSGATVVIDFTGEEGDATTDFEIQAASAVTGSYTPVAGTILQLTPLTFEATVPASGNPGFFRVHRL